MDDIKNYRFLSGGKIPLTGVDDSAEFRSTSEAMGIMGIGPEEQSGTHTSSFVKFRLYCPSFMSSCLTQMYIPVFSNLPSCVLSTFIWKYAIQAGK